MGGVLDLLIQHSREGRVKKLSQLNIGKFSLDSAKSILKEHQGNICMHGEFETAGSQISSLREEGCEHWFIDKPFLCQQEYKKRIFLETKVVEFR